MAEPEDYAPVWRSWGLAAVVFLAPGFTIVWIGLGSAADQAAFHAIFILPLAMFGFYSSGTVRSEPNPGKGWYAAGIAICFASLLSFAIHFLVAFMPCGSGRCVDDDLYGQTLLFFVWCFMAAIWLLGDLKVPPRRCETANRRTNLK